ncbi:pilus assembly protein PilP [Aquicella lusitana]|uniref:Pilus assembly protein PilP n=1 Tax=Aquicella lusitana TaxID=254246 RepID=A0A370GYB4_9COXI|nr:pilus assembly protein PilP [Aquicella lusitana]RDI48642.1 pilus assembly protein PilP [Aquicella lusitana]VVC73981.1 hypothetical protein AQULUS_17430 [Aquicella lusitana]
MRFYPYRWLYALVVTLIVIACGFFYDTQPHFARLKELTTRTQQLAQQYAAINRFMLKEKRDEKANKKQTHEDLAAPADNLSDLLVQADLNEISVRAVRLLTGTSLDAVNHLRIYFAIEGGFQSLFPFVTGLAESALISSFALKTTKQNQLLFTMDLMLLEKSKRFHLYPLAGAAKSETANPFCRAENRVEAVNPQDAAWQQSISITHLRLAGSLQQDRHRMALVIYPNGRLITVSSGSVLGKERAVVKEIKPDSILMVLPDKQLRMIRSRSVFERVR